MHHAWRTTGGPTYYILMRITRHTIRFSASTLILTSFFKWEKNFPQQ
uniref:Uncharacterized protein n=1 Tax=Anguilla anguilla TaxID=7936 RepID=A0A0E9QAP0_ANGAN